MALIQCPRCRKRISSLAEQCRHCGFRHDKDQEMSVEDRIAARLQRLKLLRYRARMSSYTGMTLMLLGIIAWWLESGMLSAPGTLARIVMAAGAVIYLLLRAYLFWLAMQLKKARTCRA